MFFSLIPSLGLAGGDKVAIGAQSQSRALDSSSASAAVSVTTAITLRGGSSQGTQTLGPLWSSDLKSSSSSVVWPYSRRKLLVTCPEALWNH